MAPLGLDGPARLELAGVSRPVNAMEAAELLNPKEGYEITEADERMIATGRGQLFGQFLIDREGVVRWTNIECGTEGLAGLGKFPTADEILAAIRTLPG